MSSACLGSVGDIGSPSTISGRLLRIALGRLNLTSILRARTYIASSGGSPTVKVSADLQQLISQDLPPEVEVLKACKGQ